MVTVIRDGKERIGPSGCSRMSRIHTLSGLSSNPPPGQLGFPGLDWLISRTLYDAWFITILHIYGTPVISIR